MCVSVNCKGTNSYSLESWVPQSLEQPWGGPTTRKDRCILLAGAEGGKKHTNEVSTLAGGQQTRLSPLYFFSSNKPIKQVTDFEHLLRDTFYAKFADSLAPWKLWFRVIVELEKEMRLNCIFPAPLRCARLLLLSCSQITSFSPKGEDFHSWCTFTFRQSEPILVKTYILLWGSGRTKEKLTYSLPFLAVILSTMLLNSLETP